VRPLEYCRNVAGPNHRKGRVVTVLRVTPPSLIRFKRAGVWLWVRTSSAPSPAESRAVGKSRRSVLVAGSSAEWLFRSLGVACAVGHASRQELAKVLGHRGELPLPFGRLGREGTCVLTDTGISGCSTKNPGSPVLKGVRTEFQSLSCGKWVITMVGLSRTGFDYTQG